MNNENGQFQGWLLINNKNGQFQDVASNEK